MTTKDSLPMGESEKTKGGERNQMEQGLPALS